MESQSFHDLRSKFKPRFIYPFSLSKKPLLVISLFFTSCIRKERLMLKTLFNIGLSTFCLSCLVFQRVEAQGIPPKNFNPVPEEFQRIAQEPGAVIFSPPKGWKMADPQALPAHVKAMVVGAGINEFPPSINLSVEVFEGTVRDYLRIVKDINHSQGSEWKDLGTIRTQAGEASLSQADALTEWGSVRMMHVILARKGMIYILTAAALKTEFPQFYKIFFESLRSLRINKDPNEMAKSPVPGLPVEKTST